MKKFFIYAAIAALVIPFVSCNNKIDYGGNGPQAKIEKAKNADNAKKITIQQGTAKDKGIKEIEFTDGGLYIVTREKTKADDNTEVITGTYTLENLVYILQNYGSVSFDGNGNVTIELQGGETVTATYQEEDKLPESDFSNSIAHTWRIDKVDLSVVADGKNIGFVKNGCDLEQIGKEIVEQAKSLGADVNVNLDQLKGYNVKFLSFTSSNTFIVEFTDAPVFKANVSGINLNSYKFTYKLEAGVDNELLNAEAECEFAPQTEKTAWLTVKVNADDFSGKVIFMMTVID